RPVCKPRFEISLRFEPRRGNYFADRSQDPKGCPQVGPARRRQPGYGRNLGGREGAMAGRTLQLRGLCDFHFRWETAGADSGGPWAAGTLHLPAARPVLLGAHRNFPLAYAPCVIPNTALMTTAAIPTGIAIFHPMFMSWS